MSPAAALARAIASRDCLPPPASMAGPGPAPERPAHEIAQDLRASASSTVALARDGHRCALARPPERVPCPAGCGRTIRSRSRARSCRACWDASPEKRLLARAAARANPKPGGRPRRPR